MKPRVNILYAPGTNCHMELAEAFRLAGAEPTFRLLTADVLKGRVKLTDCDIVALPGGWSFGDHIAAGRVVSIDLLYQVKDQLLEIREKQIPVFGVCNGFQVLMITGLLPGTDAIGSHEAILDRNSSATFESRWVDIYVQKSNCIWTQGLEGQSIRCPVAHGEGRLILPDNYDDKLTVFRYGSPEGTMDYPANPNGSPGGRAGMCDPTGQILGLMPHPERAIYPWLGSDEGRKIFEAGVQAVK